MTTLTQPGDGTRTAASGAPISPTSPGSAPKLSIVMPCLNEADTLEECVHAAQAFLRKAGTPGEIIVADNGSTDGSPTIGEKAGARVVREGRRGYGAALNAGLKAARGDFLFMGDSDASYDFASLQPFLDRLERGADLVIGNRFVGGIGSGAMPRLHRYLGNPLLSWLARFLFRVPVNDVYCGLRGLTRSAFERLQLKSPGMEFALEMIVKAQLLGLKLVEVPTTLVRDGRSRAPHLQTWKDGLRSLRFYCLCSPNWVFLYPGLALLMVSIALGGALLSGPLHFGSVEFSIHTLVLCGFGTLIGYQAVGFGIYAGALGAAFGMIPLKRRLRRIIRTLRVSFGLLVGAILIGSGVLILALAIAEWRGVGFGALDPFQTMKVVVPAGVLVALGLQTILLSLYLSMVKFQFHETFPEEV